MSTTDAGEMLAAYIRQAVATDAVHRVDPKELPAGKRIFELPVEGQLGVARAAFAQLLRPPEGTHVSHTKYERNEKGELEARKVVMHWSHDEIEALFAIGALLKDLLRKRLGFSQEEFATMIEGVMGHASPTIYDWVPWPMYLRSVQRGTEGEGISARLLATLKTLREKLPSHVLEKNADVLDELLGTSKPPPPLEPGEAWSDAAIAAINAAPAKERAAWDAILAHAATAEASKPTKKWLAEAAALVGAVGTERFAAAMGEWLPLIDRPRTATIPFVDMGFGSVDQNLILSDVNATFLKGLAWCCSGVDDASLAAALADGALACFKKVRWHGPRCPKAGNACLAALTAMPPATAAAQLSRIDAVLKQPTGKKMTAKALTTVAAKTGQTPEDLAEQAVPTYGLGLDGALRKELGEFTAELRITDSTSAEITWTDSAGKARKSAPAEVKRDHGPGLADLQKTLKDLQKMLPAHRIRLERLLMADRSWAMPDWRSRYLDHPLIAHLARRLIWTFEEGGKKVGGIYFEGKLVSAEGKALKIGDGARVRIWHPIDHPADEVRAWRAFLESREVRQPFKQAHREIYVLTDAERGTETYSNRFAGHIIRQHQFVALCGQRGWKTAVQGPWDPAGDPTPTLELPKWNLKAQFFNEIADVQDPGPAYTGVTFLSTDQVRFCRTRAEGPLPLAEVPAVVFSEVMRDVDLFVAVTSIGADPEWAAARETGGLRAHFDEYWQGYAFGDLTGAAAQRREFLATLLPRLKIAGQCRLDGRFLVVRGKLRTYKIHLGSGNILMEPDDQYLCIVQDHVPIVGGRQGLFLPFEGDATLSLILSKAFLLAADDQIKDGTITRQINKR